MRLPGKIRRRGGDNPFMYSIYRRTVLAGEIYLWSCNRSSDSANGELLISRCCGCPGFIPQHLRALRIALGTDRHSCPLEKRQRQLQSGHGLLRKDVRYLQTNRSVFDTLGSQSFGEVARRWRFPATVVVSAKTTLPQISEFGHTHRSIASPPHFRPSHPLRPTKSCLSASSMGTV